MKLKKFLSLLMVAALCVGFTACSNDDDDDFSAPASIVGTWRFDSFDYEIKASNPAAETIAKELASSAVDEAEAHTVTFNEDGTYAEAYANGDTESGTYIYSNGILSLNGGIMKSAVTASGNTLRLSMDMLENLGPLMQIEGISKIVVIAIYTKQ